MASSNSRIFGFFKKARARVEADALGDGLLVVGEVDVLEDDLPLKVRDLDAGALIRKLGLDVEMSKEPVQRREEAIDMATSTLSPLA